MDSTENQPEKQVVLPLTPLEQDQWDEQLAADNAAGRFGAIAR